MSTQKVQFVVEAVDNASPQLKKITDGVENLGEKAKFSKAELAAAGTAIVGTLGLIGSKAINTFADFEKTMSGVKAVLNPTGEEFDKLSAKARELGRSTQYSATESADAIEMLAKNGLDATQILEGASDATLNLASATGAQLATAADIATSAMLSFGLQVKDLDQVVNSITGTTNVSKFGIEDYAQALAQGGGVAKTVGVNMKDFNASIAAISPLFQSGSDAGTSFKTMLLRLVPSSDNAYSAMQDLGIITKEGANQFFDATGKMRPMAEVAGVLSKAFKGLSDEQKNQYLNTIFGTDAMRAAAAIAETGSDKFNDLSKAIEGTDAAKNAADRMNNLRGAFEQLSGAVDDVLISLGQMLAPAVKIVAVAATELANALSYVFEWFGKLPDPVQNVVKIIGGVAIAGIALAGVAAALSVALGGVASAFVAIAVAAAPWIAIAAAIGVALYALYEAWNSNFLGIQDITKQVFGEVSEWIKGTVAEWLPIITAALQGVWNIMQTVWNAIVALVEPIITGLVAFIQANWDNIKTITQGVWDVIAGYFQLTFGTIIGIFKAFLQVLGGDWAGAWETLKQTGANAWNAIVQILSGGFEILKGLFGILWETIKAGASLAWSAITATVQAAWDGILAILNGAFELVKSGFSLLWEGLMTILEVAVQAITIAIVAFIQLVTGDWDGFLNTISTAWNTVWTAIQTFGSTIWSAISGAASAAWNGIANALKSIWGGIKDFAANTWQSIKDGIVNTFTSVVNWFTGAGKEAFENGFSSMVSGLAGIAKSVFNGIIGLIENFVNFAIDGINRLIEASNKVNPFGSIPTVPRINIPRLAHGGIVEGFAGGGVVSGSRGIDTVPAMLTAGEVVLNAAQQNNLARQLNGGGAGMQVNVYVTGNEFFGAEETFAEKIGDAILGNFKQHFALQSF